MCDVFHHLKSLSVKSFEVYISMLFARERLARLKSHLNLKMVRKYRDSKGASKVQGGPDLTKSAEYPINLGLKAGYVFSPLTHAFLECNLVYLIENLAALYRLEHC